MERIPAGALILATLGLQTAHADSQWAPPIGIPVPEFGIEERHTMYAGKDGYEDAGNGPYTIYVDNTASNCGDLFGGSASKPLCEIPDDISDPGTVVEIHGGPYDYGGDKPVIEVNGTREQPVFIRGVDDGNGYPVIRNASTFNVQGQYFIVENLDFVASSVRTGVPGKPKYGRSFMALRHLEIRDHPSKNASGLVGSDIVFYKNHVHHNQGDDRHGTTVGSGTQRVWIVDNYFHHNGGDAVQFCHGCKKSPPQFIYVGRNLTHSDRENGVDLKYGKDIVVSENVIFGYLPSKPAGGEWCFDDNSHCATYSSGSDGAAVIIGSDGAPERPWIIANKIYNSGHGIRVEKVQEAWIIGNEIYDIQLNAIALDKAGMSLQILGNTMHNAEFAINQHWRDKFAVFASNNVFSHMSQEFLHAKPSVSNRSVISNNLFWNGDDRVTFRWGKIDYDERSSASRKEFSIDGKANFVADPGITETNDKGIVLANGFPVEDGLREELAKHDARLREIHGDGITIMPLAE